MCQMIFLSTTTVDRCVQENTVHSTLVNVKVVLWFIALVDECGVCTVQVKL